MTVVAAIAARTRCLSIVLRIAVVICVSATAAAAPAPSPAPAPPPAPSAPAPDRALTEADRLVARGKRTAAIAALRAALARTDSADRRCALGLLYAGPEPRDIDLPRAHLYLLACPAAGPDRRARGAAARAAVDRALRDSDLSPVEVATAGDAPLRLTVDTLRGDAVTAPLKLWLPAGRHTLTGSAGGRAASAQLTVADGNRAMVILALPPPPRPAAAGAVDFTDEEPGEVHQGAPPKVEHDSLLPSKYRKGVDVRSGARPRK
jgi:hypothetical protein